MRHAVRTGWLALAGVGVVATGCGGAASTGGTPTPASLPAPAIVQVENAPVARPQSGLTTADVVYEYSAEGGISRFSLIFFHDPPAGQKVGPVRSARTVTVELLSQWGAYLVFAGAGHYVQNQLTSGGFRTFNEDSANGNLFRVPGPPAPHNLFTDGSHLAALRRMAGMSAVSYQLWSRTSTAPAGGKGVTSLTVPVSDMEQPVFSWDAALHGWMRREPDTGPITDPTTGAPLVVPTVIVQQVTVTSDPNVVDVNGATGLDQKLSGSGSAQVFTGGNEYDATWTQPGTGPPKYTLASGGAAPIAPGEVWICLVPTGQPASAS